MRSIAAISFRNTLQFIRVILFKSTSATNHSMSFRLWTIFYVFALLAAAMATFGPLGIFPFVFVLCFWAWAFSSNKPSSLKGWLLLIGVVLVIVVLLLPAIQIPRESSRQGVCRNNLNQLAIALDFYASKHGSVPPATVAGADGAPLHSWRSLVLSEIERADIDDMIDHTAAWNAPTNNTATLAEIDTFECPSDSTTTVPNFCSYFAIVGPHTAWPEDRARPLSEITDPKSCTILLIEAHGRNVPWAKPSDIPFDEAVRLLSEPQPLGNLHEYRPSRDLTSIVLDKTGSGIHVAMADGTVRFLALPLPRELAVALLTVDGGEGDIHNLLDEYSRPQIDIGKCCALGVFVVLSLLPAAWVRRRKLPTHPLNPPAPAAMPD
jgi:hypothetical protein